MLTYIKIMLLFAGSVLLYSCRNEEGVVVVPTPEDSGVRVALFTTGNEFQTPQTRTGSALENDIGLPWVLVFDGSTNAATFVEAKQAETRGASQFVLLTRKTTPSKLLILVNPQDTFYTNETDSYEFTPENFQTLLTGKSLAEACAILRTEPLAYVQTVVPYADGGKPLPMSAVWDMPQIVEDATIGTSTDKVQLERGVAKVIIRIDPDAYYFNLKGATVVGVSRQGQLHNLGGTPQTTGGMVQYRATWPADEVEGIAGGKWYNSSYQSTEADPIYVYESAGDWSTAIIVKGRFSDDTNHGQDYDSYFKLYFRTLDDYNPFAIKRNNEYIFNIKGVNSAGYPTLQEAIDGDFIQMAVWYSVYVNDLSSYEMAYSRNPDNSYYLGVSNSQYEIYGEAGALTNLNISTAITDGGGANVNRIEVSSGLTLVSPESGSILTGGTATDIIINMDSGISSGKVRVFYGSTSHTIDVTRRDALTGSGQVILFRGYQMAQIESGDWLSLSQDGTNIREDSKLLYANGDPNAMDGTEAIGTTYYYYLHVDSNSGNGSRGGVVYTTKVNNEGRRLKMDFRQNSI